MMRLDFRVLRGENGAPYPGAAMRLADFIQRDMQAILARWETFAATRLPAAARMQPLELRDHAQQILQAVVADLSTPQTAAAQSAKSMGLAPVDPHAPETAAQTHAVLRAKSGFDVRQLASEYRALRASVLSLWLESCNPGAPHFADMIRFNEAIDQALAESIAFFSDYVDRSRNLLMGMLSHDLRSPLQTIQMTARHLCQINSGADVSEAAARLVRSGARMQALLNDMVDYNRTELGLGLRVAPEEADVGALCADELDQIRAAHPGHDIALDVDGNLRAVVDGSRIQQLLNNLVVNAVHYGAPHDPIEVAVHGNETHVRLTVANRGQPMDRATVARIFEPLERGPIHASANRGGLGLGLYIAGEIARAHGGEVEALSEEGHTVFSVQLPRQPTLSTDTFTSQASSAS